MMTQVTGRNPSPSTDTIASVTLRMSSAFCSALRYPLSLSIVRVACAHLPSELR